MISDDLYNKLNNSERKEFVYFIKDLDDSDFKSVVISEAANIGLTPNERQPYYKLYKSCYDLSLRLGWIDGWLS